MFFLQNSTQSISKIVRTNDIKIGQILVHSLLSTKGNEWSVIKCDDIGILNILDAFSEQTEKYLQWMFERGHIIWNSTNKYNRFDPSPLENKHT